MAKQCATEKTMERQNRIGKVLELMMMEMDYDDIFVSDLCSRAGISRRSFYRYFNSKEDVLRFVLEDIIRDCHLQIVLMFCPERSLEDRLTEFLIYWKEKQSHWLEILTRNHQEGLLIDMYLDWTRDEYLKGREFQTMTRNQIDISLEYATTGLLMTVFRWGRLGFKKSPREMASSIAVVMTRPIYDNILEKPSQL